MKLRSVSTKKALEQERDAKRDSDSTGASPLRSLLRNPEHYARGFVVRAPQQKAKMRSCSRLPLSTNYWLYSRANIITFNQVSMHTTFLIIGSDQGRISSSKDLSNFWGNQQAIPTNLFRVNSRYWTQHLRNMKRGPKNVPEPNPTQWFALGDVILMWIKY
eukprot:scaffold49264_cov46-Attheya_sp.AAC.1